MVHFKHRSSSFFTLIIAFELINFFVSGSYDDIRIGQYFAMSRCAVFTGVTVQPELASTQASSFAIMVF